MPPKALPPQPITPTRTRSEGASAPKSARERWLAWQTRPSRPGGLGVSTSERHKETYPRLIVPAVQCGFILPNRAERTCESVARLLLKVIEAFLDVREYRKGRAYCIRSTAHAGHPPQAELPL